MGNIKKNYRQGILAIVPVVVVVLVVLGTRLFRSIYKDIGTDSALSAALSLAECLGVLISIVIAVRQLSGSKDIAKATFVLELNKAFVDNREYLEIYNALQNCIDGRCEHNCKNPRCVMADDECKLNITKGNVSNYLTFFETINLLRMQKVIDFDVLNNLFAYRFFIAIHSKFFQQEKLKRQPENFRNIFLLEHDWLKWREEQGIKPSGIYNSMTLKEMLNDDDLYERIIKG